MKKLTSYILIITMVAFISSCKKDLVGEGPVTTENRSIGPFAGIDLRMNGNVYYRNESTWKLEISAKQSIHSMLETVIVNNKLLIRYKNGKTYDSDESIRINITGPGVRSFELNSSGNIYGINAVKSANVYLRTSGSGSINIPYIETNSIEAESLVSGHIKAGGGISAYEKIKTDGSGKIDLSAIEAKNVSARIIGSGDIKVKVSDNLEAVIDGSGYIYFRGYPFVNADISGTGRLVRF